MKNQLEQSENKESTKSHKSKKHKRLKIAGISLVTLVVLYCIAVFSNIPFIEKWRTIYIETALSTMTHQWLAEAFIPKPVVDKVREDMQKQLEENLVEENQVEIPDRALIWLGHPTGLTAEQKAHRDFIKNFDEIDISTLPEDTTFDGLWMTKCENIKTVYGDSVHTIDTINGITIININENGYVGKLAIIKDPSKVRLAQANSFYVGQHVVDITEQENCVLGINASGFSDPNGLGNGGNPVGLIKSSGNLIQKQITWGYWFVVGFDNNNNLRIGTKVDVSTLRDAVQFKPALIIDGEKKVSGSAGWGLQPRSVIGQSPDGEVMFLAIDGRKPGYSLGATVSDCADILIRYGANQAINLDGGSSTAISYMGETLNVPSSRGSDGRNIPNAWVVEGIKIDSNGNMANDQLEEGDI